MGLWGDPNAGGSRKPGGGIFGLKPNLGAPGVKPGLGAAGLFTKPPAVVAIMFGMVCWIEITAVLATASGIPGATPYQTKQN